MEVVQQQQQRQQQQQQLLNSLGAKRPSKLGTGKVAAPWAGKANLENHGEPIGVEGDDFYDSGIGSLSELQVREFDEWGGVDQGAVELEESQDGGGRMPVGTEPDICPSTQQRVESGIGQITRGIEKVELGNAPERAVTLEDLLSYCTEDFDSMLHLSVIHEEEDFFNKLLHCTKGTEYLNLQNNLYQTALHLAVIIERVDLVQKLVAAGADLLLQEKNGDTALHLACKKRLSGCVQALLFPSSCDPRGPLFIDPSQVRQQLDCYNYEGLTPLHEAVLLSDLQIVAYLLSCEFDINAKEMHAGRTALHLAVEKQNQQIVKLLLDKQADVHAQMYNGFTPICLAVYQPDSRINQMLRDSGSSEPFTDEELDEDEGTDEDGMDRYDDLVLRGRM
ncbi:NF-kappa-B inhibitor beta-like [Mustelus asterias]